MRVLIKRCLLMAALFTLILIRNNIVSAQDISGGFEYAETETRGEIKIIGYHGIEDHVIVPEYLAGQRVAEIGEKAFAGNDRIVSCDLSRTGIKKISSMAFADCPSMIRMALSADLKSIGDSAFSGCLALESIDIPFFMEQIGEYAFYGCASLKEINQEGGYLKNIGVFAFYGTGIGSITVPAKCQVGNSAFPQGISVYTAKNNVSLPNLKDYILYYIDDVTASQAVKKEVIAGQKITLSADLESGTWCVWQKMDTGQVISRKSACNVTAAVGSTVYICHITNGVYAHEVRYTVTGYITGEGILAKVTGISAAEKNNRIILKWKKSKNSDGYVIYRSIKYGSGYKEIGTSKGTKYTDKTGKRGRTYYYKISPYKKVAGKRVCGAKSSYKKYRLLGIPAKPSLKINRKNYIMWNRKGTSGVIIYVKRQGVWVRVKRLPFSKYHQNSVKISAKTVSAVKIKLYYQGKDYKAYSSFSNVVKVKKRK